MRHVFTGLLLVFSTLLAANEKQDSLLSLLNAATNDSVKIDLLFKLGMASSGETQCSYFKQAYAFDSLYNNKYLGYKPYFNLAIINLYETRNDSVECFLEKALQVATRHKDSTAMAKTYQVYGNYHSYKGNNNPSISYTEKGRRIFESLKDSFNYFRLYNNEANIYKRMGEIDKARSIFQNIIQNSKQPRDSWVIASAHLNLGAIFANASNYKDALDNQLSAYNIWKEMNDSINFCKALNNIGVTYKRLSMYSLAKSSYQEIIDTNPKGDPYAMPLALANVSGLYAHQKEFDIANQHIDEALEKMEAIGNPYYQVVLSNIKTDILIKEEKYAAAKSVVEQNIEIAKEKNYSEPYITALGFYANILFETNNYKEALYFAKEALKHSSKNEDKQHQFSNNYLIGKILIAMGQEDIASPYLMKSLELNDSIKKEKEDQDLIESALTYEIGKKEAINESLKKEAELNKTILEKTRTHVKMQRALIMAIALVFLLSLAFLIIAFKNNKVIKQLNKQLHQSNQEINEKNKKLNELINIKSKIFSIISHDLKSPMISLHNSVTLMRMAELSAEKKKEILDLTEIQVNSTIELLENLLKWAKTHESGVRVNLEKIHICDIVQQNLNLTKLSVSNKELEISTHCNEELNALADRDLLNVVIRNLLSNAIKFTPRKGEIKISSEVRDNKVVISIADNGCGISQEHIKSILKTDDFISTKGTENEPGSGLGLKLCINYLKYMNGKLEIESTPGEGSNFIVKIPVFQKN